MLKESIDRELWKIKELVTTYYKTSEISGGQLLAVFKKTSLRKLQNIVSDVAINGRGSLMQLRIWMRNLKKVIS